MAFEYTVDTATQTHLTGYWYLASGTYTFTGATVAGEIVTGLSKVLMHSVHVDTGTITSQVAEKANVASDGTTPALGSIGIIVAVADNVGTWQAIGVIAD